jgi:hypothetical protein
LASSRDIDERAIEEGLALPAVGRRNTTAANQIKREQPAHGDQKQIQIKREQPAHGDQKQMDQVLGCNVKNSTTQCRVITTEPRVPDFQVQ